MTKTRIFILMAFSFVLMTGILCAQATLPLYEGFDYAAGNLVGNAGWTVTGANTASPVQIVDESLTYAGLPNSTGKKVQALNGSNYEDPGFDIVTFGNQTETSSIYCSFIMKVINEGGTAGDYVFHISSAGTTATDFHSRVFLKKGSADGKYLIGIRNHNNDDIVYEATDRDINTVVLVVVSYDFVPGEDNDTSRVWINPALGQATPPAADLTATAVLANTDMVGAGRINLRQGAASTAMIVEIDEIRAGAWTDVTPAASSVSDWSLF